MKLQQQVQFHPQAIASSSAATKVELLQASFSCLSVGSDFTFNSDELEVISLPECHVQFQEEVVIHNKNQSDEEEEEGDYPASLWYTDQELRAMRKEYFQQARNLTKEGRHKLWFNSVEDAYELCTKSSSDSEVDDHFETTTTQAAKHFQNHYLGLEQAVLTTLSCDRRQRQDALHMQVKYWQDMQLLDAASQERMMSQISCELSRPSCVMARYMATVVAKTCCHEA